MNSTASGNQVVGDGAGSVAAPESARDPRVVRAAGNGEALTIEKLSGRENYVSWAFAMKMTLIREGTWCAVMPREGEDVDEDTTMMALSTICLSLEKTNYSLVMDAKDAKEAWDKLKNAFQDNGIYRRIGLLQQLTSIRLENFPTTEAYVDALFSTSHKLAEINFPVADEWLASLLLMGLPKYYAPMVMGLEASGQALSADAVKSKILQDVRPRQGQKSSGEEGAFYSGEQQRRNKGANPKKGKDDSCYNSRAAF